MAPFSAVPRPPNMHVTKLGLIDPDDLTEEEEQSHMWTMASQTPGPE